MYFLSLLAFVMSAFVNTLAASLNREGYYYDEDMQEWRNCNHICTREKTSMELCYTLCPVEYVKIYVVEPSIADIQQELSNQKRHDREQNTWLWIILSFVLTSALIAIAFIIHRRTCKTTKLAHPEEKEVLQDGAKEELLVGKHKDTPNRCTIQNKPQRENREDVEVGVGLPPTNEGIESQHKKYLNDRSYVTQPTS